METFMMKALQLIVALLILVTVHEFGHYIFARIFGIKVNRFYLFFNPWFSLLKYYPDKGKIELIAWTKKITDPNDKDVVISEEPKALVTLKTKAFSSVNKKGRPSWAATMYGIGWLPLGGYCDIAGMVDETKTAAELAAEPQPWEFRSKAAWKRFMVMVAGVMFNFILAIVIYAGIALHWGDKVVPFESAYEGMDYASPLESAGFKSGDILLSINGKPADAKDSSVFWDIMQPGSQVEVLRDHKDKVTITIPAWMLDSMLVLDNRPIAYRSPVFIEKLSDGMPAAQSGMLEGDRLVKVGNDTTPTLSEFYDALKGVAGKTVEVKVLRDGKLLTLNTQITPDAKIGIQLSPLSKIYPIEIKEYNFIQAIPRGWEMGTTQLTTYVSSLKLLFSKEGVKQVGGFGAIGGMYPDKWDWETFWYITAFLSVVLAFMNIIPIPALDGGYILFLLWEIVTRRKVPDKFLEVANTIGFALLFLLMILANGNDILKAINSKGGNKEPVEQMQKQAEETEEAAPLIDDAEEAAQATDAEADTEDQALTPQTDE